MQISKKMKQIKEIFFQNSNLKVIQKYLNYKI